MTQIDRTARTALHHLVRAHIVECRERLQYAFERIPAFRQECIASAKPRGRGDVLNVVITQDPQGYLTRFVSRSASRDFARLSESHVGLAKYMARRFASTLGVDEEELLSDAYEGLVAALVRYKPELGYAFSTYACHWMRHRIVDAFREEARTIAIPTDVSEAFAGHPRAAGMDGLKARMRDARLTENVTTFDERLGPQELIRQFGHADDQENHLPRRGATLAEVLGDIDPAFERLERAHDCHPVRTAIDSLTNRERFIATTRLTADRKEDKSLRELGEHLGCSKQRVQIIEARTLEKLRKRLRHLDHHATQNPTP